MQTDNKSGPYFILIFLNIICPDEVDCLKNDWLISERSQMHKMQCFSSIFNASDGARSSMIKQDF